MTLLWLVLLIFTVFLPAPAAANTAKLTADIQAAADAWVAAYTKGDLDQLMALYTPDAKVMLGGQKKLDGLPAVRSYFTGVLKRPRGRFELKFEDVQRTGPRTVQLISLFRMTVPGADGAPPRVFTGRSLLIYQRGPKGQWLIWRDIDNSTPDADAPGVFASTGAK
jgi:uncharacterized protein (TIGR02246 family)